MLAPFISLPTVERTPLDFDAERFVEVDADGGIESEATVSALAIGGAVIVFWNGDCGAFCARACGTFGALAGGAATVSSVPASLPWHWMVRSKPPGLSSGLSPASVTRRSST
jgi:hypothetical protein